MSGDHPIKCMDGSKTQTRRTAGLNKINKEPDRWEYMRTNADGSFLFWVVANDPELDAEKRYKLIKCPYGQVGDRLWVRETHYKYGFWERFLGKWIFHATTKEVRYFDNPPDNVLTGFQTTKGWYKRPSIFMFRFDSRIDRDITEVRVERVQEISPPDISAEGYDPFGIPAGVFWFKELWDSINAKRGYSWSDNPWVWVPSFKAVNSGRTSNILR